MRAASRPRSPRTRFALALTAAALALGGCAGPGSGQAVVTTPVHAVPAAVRSEPVAPLPTTAADWQPVADALGRTGTVQGGVVYRMPLPRRDLRVTTHGVHVKTALSLGGYAAFAKYCDGTMLMGDLVVTEAELPAVTDALQQAGIEQTGVHKHLLQQSPGIWWIHVHAMGDPVTLAHGLRSALDATSIPPAAAPGKQPPVDLDTAALDSVFGRTGTADGGVYKFTFPRRDPVVADEHLLPPALGITTGLNFQPLGGGRAAINGDYVMTADEVQHVIRALRAGGIDIVELHNHGLDEQPRLFYLHFWATGDAVALSRTLSAALDATGHA